MKLAHISDIHLDTEAKPKCIDELENLIVKIFDQGYDHLAITGDIVDIANFSDLYRLREVLSKLGLLNWEKTTIIPGNHDIFGKYEVTSDVVFKAAKQFIDSSGFSFRRKIDEFNQIFRETVTNDNEIEIHFPFIKVLDGAKSGIAIIAFNSVLEWSLKLNPTGSRGYIHAEERQIVESEIVQDVLKDKFTIALCHHAYEIYEPKSTADKAFIWSMELIEKEAFLKTLKKIDAKILLHGHYHKAEDYFLEGIHFMNGGALKRSGTKINSIIIHDDGSYSNEFLRL